MFTHVQLLLFSLLNLSPHLSLPDRWSLKVSQRQGGHCPPHHLLLLQGVHLALPGNDHLSSICAAKSWWQMWTTLKLWQVECTII